MIRKRGFKRGFFVFSFRSGQGTMKNGFIGFRIDSYQTKCESTKLTRKRGGHHRMFGVTARERASYTRGLQYEILGADAMS